MSVCCRRGQRKPCSEPDQRLVGPAPLARGPPPLTRFGSHVRALMATGVYLCYLGFFSFYLISIDKKLVNSLTLLRYTDVGECSDKRVGSTVG